MPVNSAFFRLVLLLWVVFLASGLLSGPHITDLNVLLPPLMTNPVEYRLVGSGGCFTWAWDHHDILSVRPEYNSSSHCSTSAWLVSIAPYSGRKETAVYAKDLLSGTVIRCEVFIDKISRIKIFHHSVKLDLDGISTLQAIGFDDQENVFSSLVGIQFLWQLQSISFQDDKSSPHLTHVLLKDTPLSDCAGFCGDREIQIKLENTGVASDLLVVKGVEIGQDYVSVSMVEPEFEHIGDTILLTVAEAMSVDPPSPIFVIVGALVHYRLKILRNNIPQDVPLPSPYHRWSVDNTSVVWVIPSMGLASAVNLGIANIVVEDSRVSGHRQLSSMHVILPDRLVLYLQPVSILCYPVEGAEPIPSIIRWYLIVGQEYVVYLKVFSVESGTTPIYITEKESVDIIFNPSTHWDVFSVPDDISERYDWQNGTRIKAISEGLGSLSASLSYQDEHAEARVLNVEQEVIVCDNVRIIWHEVIKPRIVRLPWIPDVYQDLQLKASGGCALSSEDFEWFSSDIGVASISAAGVIKAKTPGLAVIKVVSAFDPLNYDEVVIEVSIPSSISMIQSFPVEAEVGRYIIAAVTLRTENGSYYHQCDAFHSSTRWELFGDGDPFKITEVTSDVHSLGVFDSEHSENGPPCAWIQLYALSPGRIALNAVVKDPVSGKAIFSTGAHVSLKASKALAAYTPLIACQAGDGNEFGGYKVDVPIHRNGGRNIVHACMNELYLVPGTRMDIVLYGGPDPWDKDVEFRESVDIVGKDHPSNGVSVTSSFIGGETLYNVFCQTLGTHKLIFSRGNLIGNDHPVPAVAVMEVLLTCDLPSSVVVIANEPENIPGVIKSAVHALRAPGNVQVAPVTVANSCFIRITAVGIHSSGRPFANSSSLHLNWDLERCDNLAQWNVAISSENFGSTWEKVLLLHNASGLCLVRATVVGFSVSMVGALKESALLLGRTENVLTDAVQLHLISALRIDPEFLLLYCHPNSKETLSISGGTSSVRFVVNDTAVVETVQQSEEGRVLHLMLAARGIGGALVTVEDVGVNPPIAASTLVLVADVEWIKILLPDKIRLMVGFTMSIDFVAGIYDGSTFSISQYTHMKIRVHFEEDLLELLSEDSLSRSTTGGINQSIFSIQAIKLGVTTFHVSARQASGLEVTSQIIEVEVYAPLVLHPSDVYLAPGASYVLTISGGPTKGTFIEFSSTNKSSATVDITSGKLSALSSGNSTIHARAYDSVGTLICEAFAEIKVEIPTSFGVYLQNNRLGIGCKMPVFPISLQGNLFSFYEICKNFKWTIENEQVASFQKSKDFLSSSERHTNTVDDFGNSPLEFLHVLHGRSAGKTIIAVSFCCEFVSYSATSHCFPYNASEEITVVPNLPLSLGIPATWILPPFYTTKNILPVSSEDLSFHGQGRKITYFVMRVCQKGLQEPFKIVGTRLQTFNSTDIGCIQAVDGTTGRTEIASCVKVAEVSQVRIDMENFPSRVLYLDVGAVQSLVVSYHDYLGYSFLEASGVVSLSVTSNRPDVISIIAPDAQNAIAFLNGTFQIKGIRPGKALLRLSIISNQPTEDYILVLVGAYLRPHEPILHIGDSLNFSVSGEGTLSTKTGWWSTSNSSIVSVEKYSGKAIALGEGATQVFFKSTNLELQMTVTVMRRSIVLHALSETLTNVNFPSDGYKFLVQLSHYRANTIEEFLEVVDLPFDCSVNPSFLGHVKAWKDVDAGKYYCIFSPYSPEQLSHALPVLGVATEKSGDSRPMFISLSAKLRGANHMVHSVQVPFFGGYSILGVDKLNLSSRSSKNRITVLGNTGVRVSWYDHDRLGVNRLVIEDSIIGGNVEYEVKVLQDASFKDKLMFMLPGTGQVSDVEVSFEAQGSTKVPSSENLVNMLLLILFCFSILVATTVIFLRCFIKPGRPRPQPNLISASPDLRTPLQEQDIDVITPIRSTPRTPQPYTEYLRKTIDETPYVRRHGRVVDPSYSY